MLSSGGRGSWTICQCMDLVNTHMVVCSCDLDYDPMTLVYELDLDILKMYLHTKNVLRSRLSKVIARQTNRRDRMQYQPHSRVVILLITGVSHLSESADLVLIPLSVAPCSLASFADVQKHWLCHDYM